MVISSTLITFNPLYSKDSPLSSGPRPLALGQPVEYDTAILLLDHNKIKVPF